MKMARDIFCSSTLVCSVCQPFLQDFRQAFLEAATIDRREAFTSESPRVMISRKMILHFVP